MIQPYSFSKGFDTDWQQLYFDVAQVHQERSVDKMTVEIPH